MGRYCTSTADIETNTEVWKSKLSLSAKIELGLWIIEQFKDKGQDYIEFESEC